MTAHLVIPSFDGGDKFLHSTCHELKHRFGIDHATLQVEKGEDKDCHLSPDDVI
jgi:cobalt-zinc-cadmium efflux system protein